MKKVILHLCLFLFSFKTIAQGLKIGIDGLENKDGLKLEGKYTLPKPGFCSSVNIKGVKDKTTVDFKVSLGYSIRWQDLLDKGLVEFAENQGNFDIDLLKGLLKPDLEFKLEPNCNYHILHVSGGVNAYAINSIYDNPIKKTVSGDVLYEDKLEFNSPIATSIELPLEVSASLVAAQTMCDPNSSKAIAKASLKAVLGNNSISIEDSILLDKGQFLVTGGTNKKKYVRINIPAGKSTFNLTITGLLFTQSVVSGLSKLNAIMCGSNAGAIAGHSLIVKKFTGPNGTSLPAGLKITGLVTNIDYISDTTPANCPDFSKAKIETTPSTCGLANGRATISVPNLDKPTFEWSNGRTGASVSGLAKGSYYVIIKDQSGCFNTIPFEIKDQTPNPSISFPEYVIMKKGESVKLDGAASNLNDLTYKWSNGASTPAITVTTPGTYKLTVTTPSKCTFNYSVDVIEKTGFWVSDGNIKTDTGDFYDDGGPTKNYTAEQERLVTICPETPNKYIVLSFTEVAINTSNKQDALKIFDGLNFNCPLNNNLNGRQSFTASTTSKGCLTVVFKSKSVDPSASGWKATISTTDKPVSGCYTEIRACDSTFTDSGGEKGNYSRDEYKVYVLCPPKKEEGKKFTSLEFLNVKLNTARDHLAIYDGIGTSCILQSAVKSNQIYTASESSGGCLTVVFDSETTDVGWLAKIKCVDNPSKTPEYCICGSNPSPTNSCENAPLIDNLQSFCGITSLDYKANITGNLGSGFCGQIHNNSFIRIIAADTTLSLKFISRGGTHKLCSGVQLALLKNDFDCTAPKTEWSYLKCQEFSGLLTSGTFKVSKLIKGQEYYVMMDGSYGTECLYTLTAEQGIAACQLKREKEEVICNPDGSYMVKIPIKGIANNRTYRVYEKNNIYKELKESVFVDDGKNNFVLFGPYKPKREYNIIISGGKDLEECALVISGSSPCPLPPCKITSNITTACYGKEDVVIVSGKLENATMPISIVSDVYSTLIYPDSTNSNLVSFRLKKSALTKDVTLYITDNNLCQTEQIIKIPQCDECPESVDLYPNPANNKIIFRYPCRDFIIEIYDINGRKMNTGTVIESDLDTYSVDVSNLHTGVYIFNLQRGQTGVREKFTKI